MSDAIKINLHFLQLCRDYDLEGHRVALTLKSGATYFVDGVLEEWSDAVYLQPEGHEVQPVLVFKSCIEAIKIMDRPTPRTKPKDAK